MWVLYKLHEEATVSVFGSQVDVPFKDMAKGCIGVLLVFDTEESLIEYGGEGDTFSRLELRRGEG